MHVGPGSRWVPGNVTNQQAETCWNGVAGCSQELMNKLSIADLKDLNGKRVLVRADYNVPLDDKCAITDETRIKETLPTINFLTQRGAIVILCSHLGRPDGKRVESMSLKPVAVRLAEMLKQPVAFASECVGEEVTKKVAS